MAELTELRKQLEDKVDRVARAVAREIERELKGSVPIDDGDLRDSITAMVKATAAGASIDYSIGVPYAFRARPEWDQLQRRLPSMIQRAWHGVR